MAPTHFSRSRYHVWGTALHKTRFIRWLCSFSHCIPTRVISRLISQQPGYISTMVWDCANKHLCIMHKMISGI